MTLKFEPPDSHELLISWFVVAIMMMIILEEEKGLIFTEWYWRKVAAMILYELQNSGRKMAARYNSFDLI